MVRKTILQLRLTFNGFDVPLQLKQNGRKINIVAIRMKVIPEIVCRISGKLWKAW